MKFEKKLKESKWLPYTIAGCLIVLFYLLAGHINYFFMGVSGILSVLSPIIIGFIMAYVMDPLVEFFEDKLMKQGGIQREFVTQMYSHTSYGDEEYAEVDPIKARKVRLYRVASVWITVGIVIIILVVLIISLIPQLVKSVGIFVGNFDSYADSLQTLIDTANKKFSFFEIDITSLTNVLDKSINKLAQYLEKNIGNILNKSVNVGVTIFNIIISFILAIYILCDKRRLLAGWRRFMQALLSEKTYNDGRNLWIRCNSILIRYIAGDLLDGLIVGLVNFLFMSVASMDYAVLISVIVGITNLAPTFGPLAGALIGGFILIFVNPWWALWFIIFTIILQTIDGYIIKPRLFGNSLGISSLWILVSIIVFGRMFGVAGILLAIPSTAIFDIFYKEVILRRLEKYKEEKLRLREEEEARKEAEAVAIKAAKAAIRAVIKKENVQAEADAVLKEKLASDTNTETNKDDI